MQFRKSVMGSAIAVIALVFGCVSDEAHRYYAAERFTPKAEEAVKVLTRPPSEPYEVIADFQARGASIKYMRSQAALIGADAIIVGTFGGYRAVSDDWASADKHSNTYSRITGTAIKYRRPE